MNRLCCGTPFESKGLAEQADMKAAELEDALIKATNGGKLPVLCDTSPCLYRMRQVMNPALRLYEPVEFIHDFLMDKLTFYATAPDRGHSQHLQLHQNGTDG